jgi:hypothetical protein
MIYVIGVLVLLWVVTVAGGVRWWAYAKVLETRVEEWSGLAANAHAQRDHSDRQHNEIEAKLREQIQHLAERLSTLRVEKGASPEQDRFVEDPKPAEPYSQQLVDFLLGVEFEDARQLVEEEIDILRSQDLSDEQIYDIISKGD